MPLGIGSEETNSLRVGEQLQSGIVFWFYRLRILRRLRLCVEWFLNSSGHAAIHLKPNT